MPDEFVPIGTPIEIEGKPLLGKPSDARYLYYDFSEHFGQDKGSTGYKEIVLLPGQFLGIVDGHIGYT